jgi:Putative endonuclease segE, GIY-YIG domain
MWKFHNETISDASQFPSGAFGFIYRVTNISSGKQYIGRKQLMANRTLPPLKGTKRKRKVQKESDWKTYYGSHPEIKEFIKAGMEDDFEREILEFAFSPKHLTYLETRYLFEKRVLEFPNLYYNDNILGKFFRKDIPN